MADMAIRKGRGAGLRLSRGQATVEYVVVFFFAFVFGAAACLAYLWSAEASVGIFYTWAVDVLCLPIP